MNVQKSNFDAHIFKNLPTLSAFLALAPPLLKHPGYASESRYDTQLPVQNINLSCNASLLFEEQ